MPGSISSLLVATAFAAVLLELVVIAALVCGVPRFAARFLRLAHDVEDLKAATRELKGQGQSDFPLDNVLYN